MATTVADTPKEFNITERLGGKNKALPEIWNKDTPNLHLITCTEKCDTKEKDLNGLIYDITTKKVMCMSIPDIREIDIASAENILSAVFADYNVETLYDGTMIRMYCVNGKWLCATSRNTDARNVTWITDKNFDTLFTKALEYTYKVPRNVFTERLVQTNTYYFILMTPENRNIIVHSSSHVILSAVYSNETFTSSPNILTLGDSAPSDMRKKHTFSTLKSALDYLRSSDCTEETQAGLVFLNKHTNVGYKIYSFKYNHIKSLRGNNNYILYVIVENLTKGTIKEFLQYYPEYTNLYANILKEIDFLINKVHEIYYNGKKAENIAFLSNKESYRIILSELQEKYLNTKKSPDIQDIRRIITSYKAPVLGTFLGIYNK